MDLISPNQIKKDLASGLAPAAAIATSFALSNQKLSLKKTTSDVAAYRETLDGLITAVQVVKEISDSTDLLKPLKATMGTINDNSAGWEMLQQMLESQINALKAQRDHLIGVKRGVVEQVDQGFFAPLDLYLRELREIQLEIRKIVERRQEGNNPKAASKKISAARLEAGLIVEYKERLNRCSHVFNDSLLAFNTSHAAHIASTSILINQPSADALGTQLGTCLHGTRISILQEIYDWQQNENSDKKIFWLCDRAGTGKSSIAATVAKHWDENGVVVGRFFFSISTSDTSNTKLLCMTIAKDLDCRLPGLRPLIARAFDGDTALNNKEFAIQFSKIVIEPLLSLQSKAILVIDAVDECNIKFRGELIKRLIHATSELNHLKVLITGRPESDLRVALNNAALVRPVEFQLQTKEIASNIDDIRTYINYHLPHLSPDDRSKLVERADGLFIWASTAVRIYNGALEDECDITRQLLSSSSAINSLYVTALRRATPSEGSASFVYQLLAILVSLQEPMSILNLEQLLPGKPIHRIVERLQSVLNFKSRGDTIYFYHPTFQEFFLSLRNEDFNVDGDDQKEQRFISKLKKEEFVIDPSRAHAELASRAFEVMQENLHRDICNLTNSNPKHSYPFPGRVPRNEEVQDLALIIKGVTTPILTYSVKWWMIHAAECVGNGKMVEKMEIFFSEQLLNWIELSGLISNMTNSLNSTIALRDCISSACQNNATLTTSGNWCGEVVQYISRNYPIIETASLQVHHSVLVTWPPQSQIFLHYGLSHVQNFPRFVSGIPKVFSEADEMKCHTMGIVCLAYSPDGRLLASGSRDKTLRLWDGRTGTSIGEPLRGHSDSVCCLKFSPDGTRFASGSFDNTLRLWDAQTGTSIGEPLEGHYDSVQCLAFSPDGTRLTSGSSDETIRLWDAQTGASIGAPLEGHLDSVDCLAFSPDGTRIASGSSDHTLRLWNPHTRTSVGAPLEGHSGQVCCLAFSPDGTRIASGSGDGTLRLWDAKMGSSIGGPLKGHNGPVMCLSFSPDGSRIASGSFDCTLRLWEAQTGTGIGESIQGHYDVVWCLAFSPNGTRIASGSEDKTLRLWDAETGDSISGGVRHSREALHFAFSPDGAHIAASSDKALRLWDAQMGNSIGDPLDVHSSSVSCLAFSPDNTRLVSGCYDNTLRFWDVRTQASIGEPLEGHSSSVSCLVFSPDGTCIASGSNDTTLRLWDGWTGAELGGPLEGHSGGVTCIAFSPDGTRIASGSHDGTIRLWDAERRAILVGPLRNAGSCRCLAFSPDSTLIVSGSYKVLLLWDVQSGTNLARFDCEVDHWSDLCFSKHGDLIHCDDKKWSLPGDLSNRSRRSGVMVTADINPPFVCYSREERAILLRYMPNHLYVLPESFVTDRWKAHQGIIVLGAEDGQMMIVDFSHLL